MKKTIIIGCLEETLDTIKCLIRRNIDINGIITLPKYKAQGISNWVDLTGIAEENNIPIYFAERYDLRSEADVQLAKSLRSEALYVIGWQRLIPENVIQYFKSGTIGFHGSANFLPWGRGRSPINWSIIEGRNRFILHMFFITPGIDDGSVIGTEVYEITEDDTCRSLYYKTAMAQAKLIALYDPLIKDGKCPSIPQLGEEFLYSKRTPEDGKINWQNTRENITKLVRAVTYPYPGAFSFLNGVKIMIWECADFGNDQILQNKSPGEVVFVSSNELKEFVVTCKNGAVLVTNYDAKTEISEGDRFEF